MRTLAMVVGTLVLSACEGAGRLAEMVNRVKGSGVRSVAVREIANRETRARDTLRQAVERLQPSAVIYVTEQEGPADRFLDAGLPDDAERDRYRGDARAPTSRARNR